VFILADDDAPVALAPMPETEVEEHEVPVQGHVFVPPGAPGAYGNQDAFAASVPIDVLRRRYSQDLLWTVLFPTSTGNLLTFFAIWAVLSLTQFATWSIGLFMGLFWFVLAGWYAAFRVEVLVSATVGEDELPSVAASRNLAADLVEPFLSWIASWALVMLPAAAYVAVGCSEGWLDPTDAASIVMGGVSGVLHGSTASLPGLTIFVALGLALWPMVILCIVVGGVSILYRIDLIVRTIVRTFPGYLTAMVLVGGSLCFEAFLWSGGTSAPPGGRTGLLGPSTKPLVFILLMGSQVYLDIVRMRIIGLYYFHFKEGFAWSWE